MTTRTKTLLATIAIGAAALTAAPSMAQEYGHNRSWNNGGGARNAVNACTRVAERAAMRSGYRGANVTDIRDVRNTRFGFEVRGRIDVRDGRHNDWHGGGRNDWRGNDRGRDSGSFQCRFERGRVVAFDIDGIRGL